MPLKIALNELGGQQWTGGITYRNNLLKALRFYPNRVEVFLVSSQNNEKNDYFKIINTHNKHHWISTKFNSFLKRFLNFDYFLSKIFKEHSIDIFFPAYLSAGKKTASIYWIPDFQFMYLPHLYTENQIKNFKKKLIRYFRAASLIVVSSKNVQKDFKEFFPEFFYKTRVLPFVAHVPEGLYDVEPEKIAKIYHLPEDFIYVPNQFWIHKNHLMVLEAVAILKNRGIKPFIVFSGNLIDSRDPMHFDRLMRKVSELDIREQIIFLGMIPHEHLYFLIRQSKCVLNPSHFEGWSTTVEESKSVGKALLLSDLSVHYEQDPPAAQYFDRNNVEDLSKKIQDVWENLCSGPDLQLEKQAREKLPQRISHFAATFISICEEATKIIK